MIGSQDHNFDPIGWELELEENTKVAQLREQPATRRGILQTAIQDFLYSFIWFYEDCMVVPIL